MAKSDDELESIVDGAIDRAFSSDGEYPWAESNDERRRAFVFSTLAGDAPVETMEKIVQWLKSGTISRPPAFINVNSTPPRI